MSSQVSTTMATQFTPNQVFVDYQAWGQNNNQVLKSYTYLSAVTDCKPGGSGPGGFDWYWQPQATSLE